MSGADTIRDRRRTGAMPGGRHDRMVRLLSQVLPAGVGAVMAAMVIAPLFPHGEVSFLLDRNKVAVTTERLRVDHPTYRGEDDQGRPFSLTAGQAVQHSAKIPVLDMNQLSAKILLKDGLAELEAPDGAYDFNANTVKSRGPVAFHTADGYRLTTSNVRIDLKRQYVNGSGGVAGTIPSGTFSAEQLSADLNERNLTLQGHARLSMVPSQFKNAQRKARNPQ